MIGSAAGVALMAIEQVDFTWYAGKVTVTALLAYFVGLIAYFLISPLTQC